MNNNQNDISNNQVINGPAGIPASQNVSESQTTNADLGATNVEVEDASQILKPPVNNNANVATNSKVPVVSEVGNEETSTNTNSQLDNNIQSSQTIKYSDDNDDYYIIEYIGKNSRKFLYRNFNFSAFFLGYIYFFYRKCFLLGIISMLPYYLLPYIFNYFDLNSNYGSICILILAIIFAFMFNNYYVKKAKGKIDFLKAKKEVNIGDTLRKSGGTSILYAILGMILFSVPQFFGIPILYNNSNTDFDELTDGIVYLGSINLDDKISITIPGEFVEQKGAHGNERYSYIYELGDCSGYYNCEWCVIEVATIEEDKSAKSFANRMAKYYNTKVAKIKKNGIKWFSYREEYDDSGYEVNNVTEKDGIIYRVSITNNTRNNFCQRYEDSVLESFKFK